MDFFSLLNNSVFEIITGLAPEFLGMVITVGIIDSYYRRQDQRDKLREAQIMAQRDISNSSNNNDSQSIVNSLKAIGALRGISLSNVDLSGVNFSESDLRDVRFTHVKLAKCAFLNAKLQGAWFIQCDFAGSIMGGANLAGTVLFDSSLKDVHFTNQPYGQEPLVAEFNNETILPDGEPYTKYRLEQFTDSTQDDFWVSDNSPSPAYQFRYMIGGTDFAPMLDKLRELSKQVYPDTFEANQEREATLDKKLNTIIVRLEEIQNELSEIVLEAKESKA